MFILFIINCYTANLAAYLTLNNVQTNIKSLADLYSQETIKIGTYSHILNLLKVLWIIASASVPEFNIHLIFQGSTVPIHTTIAGKIENQRNGDLTTKAILKRVLEADNFATIFYQSTYRTLDYDTFCQLHMIGDPIPLQYFLAMVLQKGSY